MRGISAPASPFGGCVGDGHRAVAAEVWDHSLPRTKASLISKRTGNRRAVQILLAHTKIERTVRYLGDSVEVLDPVRLMCTHGRRSIILVRGCHRNIGRQKPITPRP